ncbi:hypothetical protein DY000_02043590 [Brassica cretica]|uniref:Ubiquitin-like protease family profile domain-containing protein n=1 Tax=Brassica cretica TaxID=69181 RepID=A0ABQ7B6W7_BRACR|nr:hypothetical protein DY000_02043590 [Brassica cretica]
MGVIISNRKLYPGYNPFAPIDKTKLKELADWLKSCPHYRTTLDKKPRKSRTWWNQILRTSLEWLEDCHIDAWINVLRKRYDANPQHFRSERMCFLDHLFAQQWRFNVKDFKDSKPDHNGLGRRLPVNFADSHWIAMWISIPKRHIVVFDSISSSISPEELNVVMEPFLYMVPYLLVESASSDELRAQYSLEPFTYERPTNIPPARAGDCGVYTLKYIECHALGIEFSKKHFAKPNGKSMRDKMAVDIFQELPDAHEFENKDNDANLDDLLVSRLVSLLRRRLNSSTTYLYVVWKRYDANPQHFRSESICFLDHLFAQQWIFNFKDFKDSKPDHNGLGRRLPGGAWNYYAGTIPSFCQSNKRHIVVFDSICSSISPEEFDVVMEIFLYMVPYLLVECASSDKVRAQYSLEPFTKDFAKPNGKSMRDKMAVDLFQELPNVHEFENKDMDDILGTYDV